MTPIKYGMRSKYKGSLLGDRINELVDDPELTNMRVQIATLISLAENLLGKIEDSQFIGSDERRGMAMLASEITKAIERHHKVTEGTRHTIRIEQIQVVVNQIVKVADDTIRDAKDRKRFISGLDRLRVPDTAGLN